jgi:hypothetical protein
MPSVYGDCRLKEISSENDIKICNKDDYFNYIKEEIYKRSNNKDGVKRPVLVFFETKKLLKEFSIFAHLKDDY